MKKLFLVLAFSFIVLFLLTPVNVLAIVSPIDMSNFSTDHAFVNQSGNKALIFGYGEMGIAADPDAGVMLPANVVSLSFDYLFFNGFHDSYAFTVKAFGKDVEEVGYFETGDSGLGTVTLNLEGMYSEPAFIGLQFAVEPLGRTAWCDFSFIKIFNPVITVNDDDIAPVPEPAGLFILGVGLLGIASLKRKLLKQP